MSKGRPTICLTMIVRDAAPFITETLASVLPYIDTWSIVDTGSVDDTPAVVERFFADHQLRGTLHHREWRGFAPNRTEALSLSAGAADYALMIDADDLIEGALDLSSLTADGYQVRFGPQNVYWRSALFRLDRRWEFRGAVHEYAMCLDEGAVTERLEGDYHFVFRSLGGRSKDQQRFQRDVEALLASWADDEDPRTAYYLGQSYRDSGNLEQAVHWFERRLTMSGWDEETFVAALELARCRARLGATIGELTERYTAAWALRPHRSEALYDLARTFIDHEQFDDAYRVICRAAAYQFPSEDILFVPADVYRWRIPDTRALAAHYIGLHDEAAAIWDELLVSPHLPPDQRTRILKNRTFSLKHTSAQRIQHRKHLVDAVVARVRESQISPLLTLTITTCRRRALFERTMDSFLQCCVDRLEIDRWICIDDGSSDEDIDAMRARYPFLEIIRKEPDERGHARSMNRLLQEVNTPYWLHLEDDFDFITVGRFVSQARRILDADPTLLQVVLNRHYAETLEQRLVGGEPRRTPDGLPYLQHVLMPHGSDEINQLLRDNPGCVTAAYWPGFSLMPSLIRTDNIRKVGAFHPGSRHFEMEFGARARRLGLNTAFLDTVTCVTTGPIRSDRSSTRPPNAYDLNGFAQFPAEEPATVAITSWYYDSDELARRWTRQFPGNGQWRGVRFVGADAQPDYWLVVNLPPDGVNPPPERTIVVQMEPRDGVVRWGPWAEPDTREFVQVRTHERFPNTLDWFLGADYDSLWAEPMVKPESSADIRLSAVVTGKRLSPGHHLRLDFLHYLEQRGTPVDIFGSDNRERFVNYRGRLPDHDKRDGLYPYRYTLAVENSVQKNYFTEKLVDAVLSECLAFYWGCEELEQYIDPEAFIRLPLHDFEHAAHIIEAAIANHEWERRLPAIRRAKREILDNLQLAPMLARVISGHRMMERLDVRVINLDRRPDRLATFQQRLLDATGGRFASRCVRVAAIDGQELVLTDEIAHAFRGSSLPLRRNQTACAISHMALWWEAATGDGSPMLILEDDSEFVHDFNSRLVEVCSRMAEPGAGIDVAMLGLLHWNGAPIPDEPSQQLRPLDLRGVMGGTLGYVVTQRGARRLWEIAQRDGMSTAVDTFVLSRGSEVDVRQAVPALVHAPVARHDEPRIDSDIQYDGATL